MDKAVLTCSSLKEFVNAAQRKAGTNYEVYVIDRLYHVEPGMYQPDS